MMGRSDELEMTANEEVSGSYGNSHGSVYDTKYNKSIRHYLTREALPIENHYRDLQSIVHDGSKSTRPTLEQLHEANVPMNQFRDATPGQGAEQLSGKVIKFGWIQGVFMRCLLNIWGVMLFLRVSWMVGQAGLLQSLLIILSANVVTTITSISMSAVATNGRIKAGGVYYMISRALGPEFGASIGLLFTLANSIAVSTYIIGFVDSLGDMLRRNFSVDLMEPIQEVRAFGSITLGVLLVIAFIGMHVVTKVQMALLVLLIIAQFSFVIGCFVGPMNNAEMARGFIGFNWELFKRNLYSDYRFAEGTQQSIASVFAVFFPAVTGIVAGANLSGDLKDPGTAIPKGTLLAILLTFITYIIYPILIASSVVRDASGDVGLLEACLNSTEYLNGTLSILDCPIFTSELCSLAGKGQVNPLDANITTCAFGTQNDFQVMELVSLVGPLIYAGCFAATLSSAIASLVGAPRVLQALAKDKIYPVIGYFQAGYGANNDPIRGYLLVSVISIVCIMIGNLNSVSTLLSNFFLASYCLINFSCFHASAYKNPGWRPGFRFYHKYLSFLGSILCLIVMFMISWITALITLLATLFLYLFVAYRKPDVNWGSSTQAASYVTALEKMHTLNNVEEHVKNYRPQILVMSGPPMARVPLMDIAHLICKSGSFYASADITTYDEVNWRNRHLSHSRALAWINSHKYKAFHYMINSENMEQGTRSLFQSVGLGKLRPNVVLLGYKSSWRDSSKEACATYVNQIHAALNMHLAVVILRLPYGVDFSEYIDTDDASIESAAANGTSAALDTTDAQGQLAHDGTGSEASTPPGTPSVERSNPNADDEPEDQNQQTEEDKKKNKKKRRNSLSMLYQGRNNTKIPKEQLAKMTIFQRKQKANGTIDVWWLYDDGGLTLLLPHILSNRSIFLGSKLRVFALGNRNDQLDSEQRKMAALLSKFRIDFGGVTMLPNAVVAATPTQKREFDDIIRPFKTDDEDMAKDGVSVTESVLLEHKEKINRHIRIRQLLEENSMDANMIVMTLPMPRKHTTPAALYMGWLEYITRGTDMPPFLFVRGNQTSVLTFYS